MSLRDFLVFWINNFVFRVKSVVGVSRNLCFPFPSNYYLIILICDRQGTGNGYSGKRKCLENIYESFY